MFIRLDQKNCQEAFKIQQASHLNPWSFDLFVSCFDGQYFAYQLLQQDLCHGYYVALQVGPEMTLMDLAVGKEYRTKGEGRLLLEHFLVQCEKNKIAEAWLEVRVTNQAAISLYLSCGFETVECRKNYYPLPDNGREDALIMKREFTPA